MKKIKLYLFLGLLISTSFTVLQKDSDINYNQEHEVISSVINDIYDLNDCNYIIKESLLLKIKKKDITRYNKIKNTRFISKKEIDTIKKIVIFNKDSLTELKLEKKDKVLLKKRLDSFSKEYKIIDEYKKALKSKRIDSKLIKQKNVNFLTRSIALEKGYDLYKFGKVDSILNIGFMNFSRVFYLKKHNYGFFKYFYLGNGTCGYNGYIFFSLEKNKWKYKNTVISGIY